MVKLIVGKKGTGKTKAMLDIVADALNHEHGSILFINSGERHIYHLNHAIRLIDISEYGVLGFSEFASFINGALSQNYDITHIFIDSLLKVVPSDKENMSKFIAEIDKISAEKGIKFTITVSADRQELPEEVIKFVS